MLIAGMPGTERCPCADDCDLIRCVTCQCSDCKWPGACRGKCRECGEPARPSALPNSDGMFDCYCSESCSQVAWDRGMADGTIVDVNDITPEQLNEALNRGGLQIAGVGTRRPS